MPTPSLIRTYTFCIDFVVQLVFPVLVVYSCYVYVKLTVVQRQQLRFELSETTKSLQHKILQLQRQVENLERTSLQKDILIEKCKMETKEGECLS